MEILGILWSDDVIDKLARLHTVADDEVEEVFLNAPDFRHAAKGDRPGEDLYYALGQTDAGRYLFVVFIYKRSRRALIVTAREMTEHEKGGYRRRKRYG